jgi:hypothetical protein
METMQHFQVTYDIFNIVRAYVYVISSPEKKTITIINIVMGFDQRIARQRLHTSTRQENNGVMQTDSRQRLDKHISAYRTVLCSAVTSSTMKTASKWTNIIARC